MPESKGILRNKVNKDHFILPNSAQRYENDCGVNKLTGNKKRMNPIGSILSFLI